MKRMFDGVQRQDRREDCLELSRRHLKESSHSDPDDKIMQTYRI